MAKSITTTQTSPGATAEAPKPQAKKPEVTVNLQEFCARLSKIEKRTELIGGFEFEERRKGRLKDTSKNYEVRFQYFTKRTA